MAVEVARYPRTQEVIVHRPSCHIWSTTARVWQVSPVVAVKEGWRVVGCSQCRPTFAVLTTERVRVVSRLEQMVGRFQIREQRRRAKPRDLDVPFQARVRKDWTAQAACRSHDERLGAWLSWLFSHETGCRWQTDMQKDLCASCPVRVDCLLTGVHNDEPFGVWGGATLNERKMLAARWRKEGRQRLPHTGQGALEPARSATAV